MKINITKEGLFVNGIRCKSISICRAIEKNKMNVTTNEDYSNSYTINKDEEITFEDNK